MYVCLCRAVSDTKIVDAIAPYPFDRLDSGFHPGVIERKAGEAVRLSAERYMGWIRDERRDPDERIT